MNERVRFASNEWGPQMKLSTFLDAEYCWIFDQVASRDTLLRELSDRVSERNSLIDADQLYAALLAREAQGSTATPEGIAIPHTMLPGVEKTFVALALVRNFVRFASSDAHPADLVFLLVGPAGSDWEHIRVLARVARLCKSTDTLTYLRAATDEADLYARILQEDARHV